MKCKKGKELVSLSFKSHTVGAFVKSKRIRRSLNVNVADES